MTTTTKDFAQLGDASSLVRHSPTCSVVLHTAVLHGIFSRVRWDVAPHQVLDLDRLAKTLQLARDYSVNMSLEGDVSAPHASEALAAGHYITCAAMTPKKGGRGAGMKPGLFARAVPAAVLADPRAQETVQEFQSLCGTKAPWVVPVTGTPPSRRLPRVLALC